MTSKESETLRQLARSWNNLDSSFIEKELAEDCIYESQWALIPIEGKEEFISYLKSKFAAIKSASQSELMVITAELVLLTSMQNRPCIVLTQITKDGIRQVSVLIKVQAKKIKNIYVGFIPNPAETILTGEYPK